MAFKPRKNQNNNSGASIIIGIVVVVVLAYNISGYIKNRHSNTLNSGSNVSGTNNDLSKIQSLDQQRQLQQKDNAVPFEQKVMYFFSNQEPAVGKITFEAENYDVVFTVRDKATNKIAAVIQLPQNGTAELNVPLGDYSVNYALPNGGTWQGLENLWGTFTSYHDSNQDFLISRENTVNGYVIHNSGIKCCHQTVVASNRNISKSEFLGGS
ncbi:hypothetical protein C9426_01525 [Serratia sp. S1B]|nr:hypothetical protein C9426_01525 [Serratia sp. S1B]